MEMLINAITWITIIVTVASLIAASTPTPKDDVWIGKIYKLIDLLAFNTHPHAQKRLFETYEYIVDCLEDDNFQQYISSISKAKINFQEIQVNKKPFNLMEGDFYKYIGNFK